MRLGPGSILLALVVGGFTAGFVGHQTVYVSDGAATLMQTAYDRDLAAQRDYFNANRADIDRDHRGQFVAVKGGVVYGADSWLDLWRVIESKPGGCFYAVAIYPAVFHEPTTSSCSQ